MTERTDKIAVRREILTEQMATLEAARIRGEFQLRMVKWGCGIIGISAVTIYAIATLGSLSIGLFGVVGICLIPAIPVISRHL